MDCWTNTMTSTGFLGVTAHTLRDDELGMESAMIGVEVLEEAHTADFLKSKIAQVCQNWGISTDQVAMCVTDNAANIVKSVKDIFDENKHFGCFAHSLNLLATDCFAVKKNGDGSTTPNVPGVNFLIAMVRTVAIASKNTNLANEIRRIQFANGKTEGTALRLKQDTPTRWNSTYEMIVRFLDMYEVVGLALLKVTRSPPMPNASQLQSLKNIKELLRPLQQATVDVSAEQHPTFSKVIPLLSIMTKGISTLEIDRTDPVSKMLKDHLLRSIEKRFGKYEYKKPLAVATVLDPRFKCIHFQHADACANAITYLKKAVWDLIQENQDKEIEPTTVEPVSEPSRNKGDIWELHDALAAAESAKHQNQTLDRSALPPELRRYLEQRLANRHACPFAVWKTLRADFPNLHALALRYLPLLASSVPTERLFSQAGIIMTDLRNRLTGEHLNQLLFLSSLSPQQWEQLPKQ